MVGPQRPIAEARRMVADAASLRLRREEQILYLRGLTDAAGRWTPLGIEWLRHLDHLGLLDRDWALSEEIPAGT